MRSAEDEAERAAYHAERRARRVVLMDAIRDCWQTHPSRLSFVEAHEKTVAAATGMLMLDEVLSPWRDLDDVTARQWVVGPLSIALSPLREEGAVVICAAAQEVLDAYPGPWGPTAYAVGMSSAEAAVVPPDVLRTLAALIGYPTTTTSV